MMEKIKLMAHFKSKDLYKCLRKIATNIRVYFSFSCQFFTESDYSNEDMEKNSNLDFTHFEKRRKPNHSYEKLDVSCTVMIEKKF